MIFYFILNLEVPVIFGELMILKAFTINRKISNRCKIFFYRLSILVLILVVMRELAKCDY